MPTDPPPPNPPGASSRRAAPAEPRAGERTGDAWIALVLAVALAVPALLALLRPGRARPRLVLEPHRIDVNRARPGELRALPGVGRVLAERLDAARREAPFRGRADLERVRGVGPVSAERIARHARFGRPP